MGEPKITKMKIVPSPADAGMSTINFTGEGTVIMDLGRGQDTQVCGNCGAPILKGMHVTLAGVALPCKACGTYNEMIPLAEV